MSTFRFLTAGESHGKALTVIIEGLPAGLPLTEDYIALDLHRRQGGYGRSQRQQIEQDRAEIISGLRHGLSTDEALRRAQLSLLRAPIELPGTAGGTRTVDASHPFAWAGFQLIGDWW